MCWPGCGCCWTNKLHFQVKFKSNIPHVTGVQCFSVNAWWTRQVHRASLTALLSLPCAPMWAFVPALQEVRLSVIPCVLDPSHCMGHRLQKTSRMKKRVFMLFAASKINLKYAFNVQGTCWELSISPVLPGLLQHTRLVETEQQLFKSTLSHLLTLSRPPIGPKHAVLQKTDTISNSTFWLYFHPTIKYYQKKHNRIFLRQNSVRLKLNSWCSLPRESYSPGLAGLAAVTKPCMSTSCTHTL